MKRRDTPNGMRSRFPRTTSREDGLDHGADEATRGFGSSAIRLSSWPWTSSLKWSSIAAIRSSLLRKW